MPELHSTEPLDRYRRWLVSLLNAGGVLLVVGLLSGALSGILSAAKDAVAAGSVRGIALLCAAGLSLDAVALLVVSALAVVRLIDTRPSRAVDESRQTPPE